MPPTNSPLLGSTGPNSYLPNQSSYESISWLENIATRCSTSTIQSISGASAGLASCIAACPLDVIKTNLQGAGGLPTQSLGSASASVRRPLQDRGLLGTGRLIWREGGFRGMYRGLAPAMLAYLPRWTVYFTVYHESNEALTTRFDIQQAWIASSVSAGSAGICSTISTNPLWVVKTRLMTQSGTPGSSRSALDVAQSIYRKEGMVAFYSGLTPALLGVTHLAIQFPLYEQLKRSFTGSGLGGWTEEGGRSEIPAILISSSLSKMCAGSATYPHEVIRTRLQMQQRRQPSMPLDNNSGPASHYIQSREGSSCTKDQLRQGPPSQCRGIINTSRTILREEGWRALYAGMGTSMIRAIPSSATTMLVYEVMVHVLKTSRADGERKLRLRDGPRNTGHV
ncbi:hypothetical protein FALCPG4_018603 [Fusarium falciforme]